MDEQVKWMIEEGRIAKTGGLLESHIEATNHNNFLKYKHM